MGSYLSIITLNINGLNAHFIKLVGDRLCIAVLIKERICDDKRSLCASDCSQFIESHGEATLFNVNLFRCSKPKHIFSPLCHCFDVDKVLYTYVFGHTVATPRSASQCKGGSELEVVQVADTALCGGSVDKNTACSHSACKCMKFFFFRNLVDVER